MPIPRSSSVRATLDPDDEARWLERAAIREHDGGQDRRAAELVAWGEVLDEIRERLGTRMPGR